MVSLLFSGGSKLDLQELRRQQIRVGLLKAARVLLQHQDVLRKVLHQVVLPQTPSHPEIEAAGSDDESEVDAPNLILHQLMVAATQPSPLKATFTREELEVCPDVIKLFSCSAEFVISTADKTRILKKFYFFGLKTLKCCIYPAYKC